MVCQQANSLGQCHEQLPEMLISAWQLMPLRTMQLAPVRVLIRRPLCMPIGLPPSTASL